MCYSGKCNYEAYDGECLVCKRQMPDDASCVQHEMEIDLSECGITKLIVDVIGSEDFLGEDVFEVVVNQVANCHHYNPITTTDMLPALIRLTLIKEQLKNIEIKYDIFGKHQWLNDKCEEEIRDTIMEAW